MIEKQYLTRAIEGVVNKAAAEFPSVVLTGPRQSGKTTLLKHIFSGSHRYVSLEPTDIRLAAANDPRGFLDAYEEPLILDEIQYAPALLPYIKEKIDDNRKEKGRFILTGSQNLMLMESITETLAGRAAILKLLPVSFREVNKTPLKKFVWEKSPDKTLKAKALKSADLLRGWFPELVTEKDRDAGLWYSSYLQTYIERDVRTLRNIGDLTQFQIFLRVLASRSAQLLDISGIARDIGVAVNTIKAWISVLEATYQIFILRPYYANIGKRLVKSPKVYFTDTGLLCHLTGIKDDEHAIRGPMSGALFETAVLMEIIKTYMNQGIEPQVYFFRTATGTEVDFIIEDGGRLIPIEAKLTSTPRTELASAIQKFMADIKKPAPEGYVVYNGDMVLPLVPQVKALPFSIL